MKLIYKIFPVFLLLGFALQANSQGIIPTKGKEFWMGFMTNFEQGNTPNLDLFIVGDQNTSGTVSIPGLGTEIPFVVTANNTTIVDIPAGAEHYSSEVIENLGIYIETEDTVSVFAINFKDFTADGTKVLPIRSTGIDYMISAYPGLIGSDNLPSEFLIVASADDTEIEITPTANTVGGNLAGDTFTIILNEGESYQVKGASSTGDFTGTRIVATEESGVCRPFSVFSGSVCTNIPDGCFACDHIFEQNFPVDTWGDTFYVVPFDLIESCTYRILAREDGTEIFVDGVSEGFLDAGEFVETNFLQEVACVTASAPISVTQYMEGVGCVGADSSDPAMLILNDANQKINNVTFSTVVSANLSTHRVTLISESQSIGTITLDGVPIDAAAFAPFPFCADHSFARVEVTEGSHTLDSQDGFTAYIYGLGSAESYAYSAGSFRNEPLINVVDSIICGSDEVTLQAPPDYFTTYWYAQSDPETILSEDNTLTLFPPIQSDVYVAVGSIDLSGCEEETLFLIESEGSIAVEASPDGAVVCQYESLELGVEVTPPSPIYEYTWSPAIDINNASLANPTITPSESRWYTVVVESPTGCAFGTDSVYVEVIQGNVTGLEAVATPQLICSGEQTELSATIDQLTFQDDFDPGISFGLWSDISNGVASNDCGSVSGDALYFNGVGERSVTTIDLDLSTGGNISFAIKIGSGVFPCDDANPGENVIVEYSTDAGGIWNNLQLLPENAYPDFTTVNIAIPNGAMTPATRIRWRQTANSGADQDNWALDNAYVAVESSGAFDFVWTPAATITNPNAATTMATPIADTRYYVTVIDDVFGCEYIDSVDVEVGQPFSLNMTPDTAICDIAGITLQATPNIPGDYNYVWSDGGGTLTAIFSENPVANPTTTTTYDVTVTSAEGCSATGSVQIIVNELLSIEVTTDNNDFCSGNSAQLNGFINGGQPLNLDYSWVPAQFLDDATIANPVTTPTTSISYTVTITDPLSECSLSAEIDLDVTPSFNVDAGPDVTLCETAGHQLNATNDLGAPVSWLWSPSDLLSADNVSSPTILQDTTHAYIVTATDVLGCSATDTVIVNYAFNTFELGPDFTLCAGEEATLSTSYPTYTTLWSTSETTESIVVDATDTYEVTITSPLGCTLSDEVFVEVFDFPVIDLGEDQIACEGETVTLDPLAVGNNTFFWSTNQVSPTIGVQTSGEYQVFVTNEAFCTSTDSVFIAFTAPPILPLQDAVTICDTDDLTLSVEQDNASYLWNTGDETASITVNEAGMYYVDITLPPGCVLRDSLLLTTVSTPVSLLPATLDPCEGDVAILDTGLDPSSHSFLWNQGSINAVETVSNTGQYLVQIDNGFCVVEDSILVTFRPYAENPWDSALMPWCFELEPLDLILDAQNPNHTYLWSTGSTDSTIVVTDYGSYGVQITNAWGCPINYEISVEEFCAPNQVYIPTGFTPNQDGINDVLFAKAVNIADFHFEIYNRWGEKVFESFDIEDPWTGEVRDGEYYNGNNVYSYTVTYSFFKFDGTKTDLETQTGMVQLIR